MGTRVALGDAQVRQEKRYGLGGHGWSAIGMDGQLVGDDVVLADGLSDQGSASSAVSRLANNQPAT